MMTIGAGYSAAWVRLQLTRDTGCSAGCIAKRPPSNVASGVCGREKCMLRKHAIVHASTHPLSSPAHQCVPGDADPSPSPLYPKVLTPSRS
jgi:hypothetical protein